ncbi:MAG TPA: hypothetical protein VIB08_06420, partial [Thermoanaerobaculia bacterium]
FWKSWRQETKERVLKTADQFMWGGLQARIDALARERDARLAAEARAARTANGARRRATTRRAAPVAPRL